MINYLIIGVDFTSWAGILLETSRRKNGCGRWTRGGEFGGTGLQVKGDKAGLVLLCLLLKGKHTGWTLYLDLELILEPDG